MVHKDDLNFRSITKKNKNQDHHYIVNDDQDRFIEIRCKPFRIQFKTEF